MCRSDLHPQRTPTADPQVVPIAEVIESNLAEYWLSLGSNPSGSVFDNGSVRGASSGGPFFNRVVAAQLGENDVDRQIEEIRKAFNKQRSAITWLTGPSTEPHDLGERLERHGFSRYEPWKGMAHDLSGIDALPSIPQSLDVVRVNDPGSHRDWCRVICESFGLPVSASALLPGGLTVRTATDGSVWTHNLAYQGGVPVAASTLFVSGQVAGVYLVATVPKARNQGLGTAMTSLAVCQAAESGCSLAVLHATGAGQRIYENLGFQHYCDIGVYRIPAPQPLWKRFASSCLHRVRGRAKRASQRRTRTIMNGPTGDTCHANGHYSVDVQRPS